MSDLKIKVDETKINFKMDAEYKGVSASINGVDLDGDLTSEDLFIPTLERVEKLEEDVNDIQAEVDVISEDLSGLKSDVATNTGDIESLNTSIASKVDKNYVDGLVASEVSNRESGDSNLQNQIDGLVAKSDVVDIVGTYQDLQNYDTSTLGNNDIVKVLNDSTHDNSMSYYRWNLTTWVYVGSEGAYYTKSESDSRFVPQTRTINGKALSQNISLDYTDVGALSSNTVIPSKTSDLTNDSGFITSASLPTKTSDLTNDSGFITSSALSGYATETWVQNYIASLNATNTRY